MGLVSPSPLDCRWFVYPMNRFHSRLHNVDQLGRAHSVDTLGFRMNKLRNNGVSSCVISNIARANRKVIFMVYLSQ